MRAAALHLTLCAAAAVAPFAFPAAAPAPHRASSAFPGWPATFEGRALRQLPATELDARFLEDLPGEVRRFTDGESEVLLRWSAEPTRAVHPSSVCFRADGWDVSPLPQTIDAAGRAWGRFRATRGGESLEVRERVEDADGRSWPEPTAWYWASVLGNTSGPAWAWTVARRL